MDDSGWPGDIVIVLSLLVTALLARFASIGNFISRSAVERLREENTPRAGLLFALYRPRNLLGEVIALAQMVTVFAGGIALIGVVRHLQLPGDTVPALVHYAVSVLAFTFISTLVRNIVPSYRREDGTDRHLPRLLWLLAPIYILFFIPAFLLQRLQALAINEDDSKGEEEILQLVQSETEEGTIEQEEREMIEGVFEFGDTTVREIMVPRIDIICAEVNTPSADLLALIQEFRHSRIPIYEDRVDHMKGMIYAKDLLHALSVGESINIPKIMRPPYFVPENKKIDELLREFKNARVHMAIVVDEYGGTSGIVTLEDVIEEIVGEIQDEYDEEEQLFHWTEDGQVLVADARIDIEDLNLLLNVELPQDGYETLGGFIYNHLGHVPDPKETFEFNNLEMHIVEVDGQRITHVQIRKQESDSGSKKGPEAETA